MRVRTQTGQSAGVICQRIKIRLFIIAPFPCQKEKLLVSGMKTDSFHPDRKTFRMETNYLAGVDRLIIGCKKNDAQGAT